jgi:malonate-semialdehyde dehydrogenase (acetylating)/methylmalonate-semialdehyde dehydrogenase
VNQLLEHPGIDAVSFVGSTPVARHVYLTGTSHGKRVQALGGAKNHMVVCPTPIWTSRPTRQSMPDSVRRANGAWPSAWSSRSATSPSRSSTRSSCGSTSWSSDPARCRQRLRTGHHQGASRPDRQLRHLGTRRRHHRRARRHRPRRRPGFFVGPCLLDGVRPGTKAYDDEIFGPVLGVARVATYAQAVDDDQQQPLRQRRGDLHSRRQRGAALLSREVTVGMIGINVPIPVPIASYSFGGWKNSLFGTRTSTAPRDSPSTRGPRSSRRAGPNLPSPRSTSVSRPLASGGRAR